MNNPVYQELLDVALRRPLTPSEEARWQAWLAAHPQQRTDAEVEMALSQGLNRLPDKPLASNFTALVMQAAQREAAQAERASAKSINIHWLMRWFSPRHAALALTVVSVSFVSWQQYDLHHRKQMAESVAKVSEVAALPSLDVLKDFEAIRRLSQTSPESDMDLLAALQ